jgi:excisionase family DNA binding protein
MKRPAKSRSAQADAEPKSRRSASRDRQIGNMRSDSGHGRRHCSGDRAVAAVADVRTRNEHGRSGSGSMTDRTSRPRRRASSTTSRALNPAPRRGVIGTLRTIDELAELWGVSPRTVQRRIKSHALQAHRIGRLVRISDADAAAFLEENRDD